MGKITYRGLIALAAIGLFVVPIAAIAAGGFSDVDDANIFKADIQWMADSGVTKGCNPPTNDRFCPQNSVTREQMAAFMHCLAEAKVVKADTAVSAETAARADSATNAGDSDRLDGMHADDVKPLAVAQVDETVIGTSITSPTTVNSMSITVPANGVLIITGSVYLSVSSNGSAGVEAYLGTTEIGTSAAFDVFSTATDDRDHEEWLSYTTAVGVTPGTYTVSQKVGLFDEFAGNLIDGSIYYNGNTMTATFIPGGTVTASTAGTSTGSMTGR